jgi:hypothetical protein
MDRNRLVLLLEHPFSAFDATLALPEDVLLAGLTWPTEHWADLALSWIEEGAPVNDEIARALETISEKPFSQRVRHRSFALAVRWRRRTTETPANESGERP